MTSMTNYQKQARQTAKTHIIGDTNYLGLKLAEEAGEVAGKLGKAIRDHTTLPELKPQIIKELGDVLWYVAMLADAFGVDLETIATVNVEKLQDRHERGVIGGSGDDR